MTISTPAEGHIAATPLVGLLGDTKFGASRPAGATIIGPNDLTTQERDHMLGLIKAWLAIEYRTDAKTHTGATHEIALPDFLKKKKLFESAVEAGVWVQDLFAEAKEDEPRESPTKKRKRQVEGSQGSPKRIRREQKDAHRVSSKAFLSVGINKKRGEPRWQWKDLCDQAAPNDVVDFRESLRLEDWQMRCIQNHDYHEQSLTYHYNQEPVAASTEQLMIQWAKDDTVSTGMPVAHINSCPELREPQLAAPGIRAYHEKLILAMDKARLPRSKPSYSSYARRYTPHPNDSPSHFADLL
ncbi:hypothetical protein NCS52_00323600 [Fusarium sp. LHS14.1]|nr:hypothetical protein NCS52_00323600 [Fusarium sp. LHS14.1]